MRIPVPAAAFLLLSMVPTVRALKPACPTGEITLSAPLLTARRTGQNFSCATWATAEGRGQLANGFLVEEDPQAGDTANLRTLARMDGMSSPSASQTFANEHGQQVASARDQRSTSAKRRRLHSSVAAAYFA